MRFVIAFAIGLIFGMGILIAGMANPAKIINFFDIAALASGGWDPSLAFVMGGALSVTGIGYRLVMRRKVPVINGEFPETPSRQLSKSLIGGAALFGTGWGIAGFCPGGALPVIGVGNLDVIVFVLALTVGIVLAQGIQKLSNSNS